MKPLPSLKIVKELLSYDPMTGVFTRISSKKKKFLNKPAGAILNDGYVSIRVAGDKYMAHRLAWLIMTGADPGEKILDHKNCNRSDNRFENLRIATFQQNCINSKPHRDSSTGYKGVIWKASIQRYYARINFEGKSIHLGSFKNPEDAHSAYCDAAKKLYSEFARSE